MRHLVNCLMSLRDSSISSFIRRRLALRRADGSREFTDVVEARDGQCIVMLAVCRDCLSPSERRSIDPPSPACDIWNFGAGNETILSSCGGGRLVEYLFEL
jgi:hypothetical protein